MNIGLSGPERAGNESAAPKRRMIWTDVVDLIFFTTTTMFCEVTTIAFCSHNMDQSLNLHHPSLFIRFYVRDAGPASQSQSCWIVIKSAQNRHRLSRIKRGQNSGRQTTIPRCRVRIPSLQEIHANGAATPCVPCWWGRGCSRRQSR